MLAIYPRIELRGYQKDLIQSAYQSIRDGHRRVLMVSPTGSGKTIVGTQIIKDARRKGRKVLFLVHLDPLVSQTFDKLRRFGIADEDVGFIKAGWPENREAPIQIASLQTLSRRQWWKGQVFDVLMFDEAHETSFHTAAEKVRQTFEDAFVIGLTATPWRLKRSESLKIHFDTLVHGPLPRELQAMGALAKMKYFACPEANLDDVHTLGGDYQTDELSRACNRPEIIQHVFREWKRLADWKRTIAFCVDVSHATAVADHFTKEGVPTALVIGSTPIKERTRIYSQFETGEICFIASIGCLSTGFDSPAAEVGLMLRPTKSKALFHQQTGRIMRPYKTKEYGIILDHAGNVRRHGIPETLAGYWLVDPIKTDGEIKLKECPDCHAWVNNFAQICPECGFEFVSEDEELPPPKPLEDVTLDLLKDGEAKKRRFYRDKLKSAYYKSYNPDWARHKYKARYGNNPQPDWALGAVFAGSVEPLDLRRYAIHLSAIAREKSKQTAWILQHFMAEFGTAAAANFPQDLLNSHEHTA